MFKINLALIFFLFNFFCLKSYANEKKIFIIAKVDKESITNYDIQNVAEFLCHNESLSKDKKVKKNEKADQQCNCKNKFSDALQLMIATKLKEFYIKKSNLQIDENSKEYKAYMEQIEKSIHLKKNKKIDQDVIKEILKTDYTWNGIIFHISSEEIKIKKKDKIIKDDKDLNLFLSNQSNNLMVKVREAASVEILDDEIYANQDAICSY